MKISIVFLFLLLSPFLLLSTSPGRVLSAEAQTRKASAASIEQDVSKVKPPSTLQKKKAPHGSIQIVTDRLEADDKKKVVLLTGNITIRWEDFVLTCDQARAYYKEVRVKPKAKDKGSIHKASSAKSDPSPESPSGKETEIHHEIIRLEAEGHVKVTLKNRVALSGKAVYEAKSRLIILTDSPRVWRGKDFLCGDRITVYLDEDRSVIESGPKKKVSATFYQPPETKGQAPVKKNSGKVNP
ncbi:MAG: hypothetical protein JRI95_00490 [Deltaproteobacteria bacterium]|nr:hypothetical protein [Deltaproteobacteria bacterium]MBW2085512.1 hypothetical protein [Deltaproteobacteria bacterium]